jgi:hypothetical protein
LLLHSLLGEYSFDAESRQTVDAHTGSTVLSDY